MCPIGARVLKKVKSGEALVIPAQTFNTFIDAARNYRQRAQNRGQKAQPGFRSSGIILVKNVSGRRRTLPTRQSSRSPWPCTSRRFTRKATSPDWGSGRTLEPTANYDKRYSL